MYQVLGSGRAAKLLLVREHTAPRSITTAPAADLTALIRPLEQLRTTTAGALAQLARLRDGAPLQLRRTLLATFDAAHRDQAMPSMPPGPGISDVASWVHQLATRCRNLPDAVTTTIRAQVGQHLHGLDGVLVPAQVSSTGWRPPCVSLVISPALHHLTDDDWDTLLCDEDPLQSNSLNVIADAIVDGVYDQCDIDTAITEVTAQVRSGHLEYDIEVTPAHLVAWIVEHRPHLADLLHERDRPPSATA